MNERERYIASITFGSPDKVTFSPGGPRESTLIRWRQEGLPEGVHYFDELCRLLGLDNPAPEHRVSPDVSFRMIPEFEERVLEHRDGHYIIQDWSGGVVEISDTFDATYLRSARDFVTRKWHRFPVESRADWEEMKKRYNASTAGRFPEDFEERCEALRVRDYPSAIAFSGPFWQMRDWCGFENLCILMIEDPELVDEMSAFWADFVSEVLDLMLPHFTSDRVLVQEDMAYKAHSMISPAMVRRFLMPAYDKWVPKLKDAKVPVLEVDSDGFIGELIPLWIEAGFNCCSPIEVAAGNDIVAFRRQYGQQMAFQGGIDKRAIAQGGTVIEAELQRVVPPLLEQGGFIPGCDHGVPHDISWPDFIHYSRELAKLTGWL